MDEQDSHCPYLVSSETQPRQLTSLAVSAGKDLVELNFDLGEIKLYFFYSWFIFWII